MRAWAGLLGIALMGGLMAPAQAQPAFSLGQPIDPDTGRARDWLRTIDDERLFRESQFGQRVTEEIAEASRLLEAENDALLEELTAREAELTAQRAEMSVEEFRAAANQFDAEAEAIRRAQAEKTQRLSQFEESERRRFFSEIGPILQEVLAAEGGQIIIDARAVIIGVPGLDITDAAAAAMDAEIGDGGPAPFPLGLR